MYKALVVGLGMGQQYKNWLEQLSFDVTTIDPDLNKNADFVTIETCLDKHNKFDLVYIGTPNYTHEPIARQLVNHTKILLIEKPGFQTHSHWMNFVKEFYQTRIMMVKNNQYRPERNIWRDMAYRSEKVCVTWQREKGIPSSPWFIDPVKSYGGVSRDLMPHMLSYFTNFTDYSNSITIKRQKEDLLNIGIDTWCIMEYTAANDKKTQWILFTDWQNESYDSASIEFIISGHSHIYDLGSLCPSEPYLDMITDCVKNVDNDNFWNEQLAQDLWIHQQLEL